MMLNDTLINKRILRFCVAMHPFFEFSRFDKLREVNNSLRYHINEIAFDVF